MRTAIKDIIGKTVSGVIVKAWEKGAEGTKVFLLFSDGTYYELYSAASIQGAGGVDRGTVDDVHGYLPSIPVVFEAHADP